MLGVLHRVGDGVRAQSPFRATIFAVVSHLALRSSTSLCTLFTSPLTSSAILPGLRAVRSSCHDCHGAGTPAPCSTAASSRLASASAPGLASASRRPPSAHAVLLGKWSLLTLPCEQLSSYLSSPLPVSHAERLYPPLSPALGTLIPFPSVRRSLCLTVACSHLGILYATPCAATRDSHADLLSHFRTRLPRRPRPVHECRLRGLGSVSRLFLMRNSRV
jgi:hypothetical protein